MSRKTAAMAASILWILQPAPSDGASFVESFDQPGSDPTQSAFSVLLAPGSETAVREALEVSQGAPSTGGLLPVEAGGDLELRVFEGETAGGSLVLLVPDAVFGDVEISAWVGIGHVELFGSRSAMVLARVQGTSFTEIQAYAAWITHVSADEATLGIGRVTDGVLHATDVVVSDPFPVSTDEENYRLVFRAEDDLLSASLFRLQVIEGVAIETTVDLGAAEGTQTTLSMVDDALETGGVGLRAFARGDNSVFFDDVMVLDILFSDGFEGGDLARWSGSLGASLGNPTIGTGSRPRDP